MTTQKNESNTEETTRASEVDINEDDQCIEMMDSVECSDDAGCEYLCCCC